MVQKAVVVHTLRAQVLGITELRGVALGAYGRMKSAE